MDKERGVVNHGKWFKRESVLIETERQIEERRESPHPSEHSGWVFRCPSEPSEPGDTDMAGPWTAGRGRALSILFDASSLSRADFSEDRNREEYARCSRTRP